MHTQAAAPELGHGRVEMEAIYPHAINSNVRWATVPAGHKVVRLQEIGRATVACSPGKQHTTNSEVTKTPR